jgi:hypothetical protein
MIMPAIFGAFGNFLLPTQLGVHDVAFPRLNSAAFWFLPGGLIMLCHLVCTDRRYARMNCFNIRELQSVLKRKFFVDLVNTHDHRNLLESSMVGLRYKTNASLNLDFDVLNFYNLGTYNTGVNKLTTFNSPRSSTQMILSDHNLYFVNFFNFNFFKIVTNSIFDYLSVFFINVTLPTFSFNNVFSALFNNINFYLDINTL